MGQNEDGLCTPTKKALENTVAKMLSYRQVHSKCHIFNQKGRKLKFISQILAIENERNS